MISYQPGDWRHLAEQASKETDPAKLMELVKELNRILEEREEEYRSRRQKLLRASA